MKKPRINLAANWLVVGTQSAVFWPDRDPAYSYKLSSY